MWIANDWKEYEVIDTSCGEKLERSGKIHAGTPGPTGDLGHPKDKPWMEKHECSLPQKQKGRR